MTTSATNAVLATAASILMPAFAVAADPSQAFSAIPISAGITGAFVCAMKLRANHPGMKVGVTQFITVAMSGAGASIFGSQFLIEAVGWSSLASAVFVHFGIGLVGSALCDKIVALGPEAAAWILGLLRKRVEIIDAKTSTKIVISDLDQDGKATKG